jgi:Right handed beta helix region
VRAIEYRGNIKRRRRRLLILLISALVAFAIGLFGAWYAYWQIGRTPDELITYAERRLQGHPSLESTGLPVLFRLRRWFGEPEYLEQQLPFSIPKLPPNTGSAGTNDETEQVQQRGGSQGRQTIRVGAKRTVSRISTAAQLAKAGDIVEVDAGDYVADVAVWEQAELTIRGVGGPVRLIAFGASAEAKAIWVIRGGNITVENIQFIGTRVEDGNGAGIRFETGHLIVRNCLFFDNEDGVLTTPGDGELEIENSEFAYNGRGDGQTHNLYAGEMKSLRVTGSYFHHANVGHLLKSRAAKNYIAYNRLTDETGGRASYEMEFPNGGQTYVIGNIIQQTVGTSNSTLISFGTEEYKWPINQLYLVNNTLVNDHPRGGAFLRVMPGVLTTVKTQNNLLAGKGGYHAPDILESLGDVHTDSRIFVDAVHHDYRLNAKGRRYTAAGNFVPPNLIPDSEYVHPMKVKKLDAAPAFAGAIQTPGP